MGQAQALFTAGLVGQDLFDLFARPAVALHDPLDLDFGAAVDHPNGVDTVLPAARFGQQRDVEHHTGGRGSVAGGLDLGAHDGVDDGFELLFGLGVGEDQLAHGIAVERAFGGDEAGAKGLCDGCNGGATRGGAGAGDGVGIDQLAAQLLQHVGHRAFAAANAAGEANAHRALWGLCHGSWGMSGMLGHSTNKMAAPAKKGPKGM